MPDVQTDCRRVLAARTGGYKPSRRVLVQFKELKLKTGFVTGHLSHFSGHGSAIDRLSLRVCLSNERPLT